MKKASDFISWKVTDISLRPYKEMWSMNPSIHFDGAQWRCLLRCTDYAMPDGAVIRSSRARPGEARTKNAMVIFDPSSWKPIEIYKVRERDGVQRAPCENIGFEDIRIFTTDRGGLQGIAASLHLLRETASRNKTPEQVLLTFDENYDISAARPIRGAWNEAPQKNWVPFDRCAEPRFLFSIARGELFDDCGALRDEGAGAQPASRPRRRTYPPDEDKRDRARERARDAEYARAREQERARRRNPRPFRDQPAESRSLAALRGGTQLCRVGDDAWLGVGHEMQLVQDRKYYWHVWYLVDSRGKMKAASPPMKLAQNGIEFAAGLAIDGDRVVVSFGVDDMECRLGETTLPEVLAVLSPVDR